MATTTWRKGLGWGMAACALAGALPAMAEGGAPAVRHPVTIDDILALRSLSGLECAPDGKQAVYVVGEADLKADKRRSALWLADLAGGAPLQLTSGEDSASAPSFSPDGTRIAFLSKRGKDKLAQIWLLDRRGGEASRLTDVKGDIAGFRWSPDSKSLLLMITDPAPEPPKDDPERPLPVVVDDVKFKEDGTGFITAKDHAHLALFDVATKAEMRLTATDSFDVTTAEWSPDGKTIAYLANHALDTDAPATEWLTVVEAKAGAQPRVVARIPSASGQSLIWSADGAKITHLMGNEPKLNQYNQPHLAQTEVASGKTRLIVSTADIYLQRLVDLGGGRVGAILAEDRHEIAAVIDPVSGVIQRLGDGKLAVADQCGSSSPKAPRAVIASGDAVMPELYVVEGGAMRVLTAHNRALNAGIAWSPVRDFAAKTSDGSEVHGLLTLPAGYAEGQRYPTVLWIHGGPTAQDAHEIDTMRQWIAAQGYAVLAVNYRGSSGRGDAYGTSIAADWGNKEVLDLNAATDWAVAQGIADPARLMVGGWSYGGILTDFLIVRDNRFKAAFSGAGEGNIFALFGVDQYIQQYAQEVGAPWKEPELWMRLSEPLLHADRIKTPTLFMGGIADDNVPLIGGQQLYQALKLTGVPTRLVGYPDENHGIARPSFQRDRLERIVDWFKQHLK
ncbi:S9 family peptidase [Novosphingobium sp.]|uniref:S9 family peptidase n=1 Tax=Novosphingobium sp. TaxID=1874826 RepID=UPI001DB4FDA3|nr:S9 family peptidase [Novosphingobium sp.]MBX9663499.1 S9 family peptidase [Novosphingobium sp.]